MPRRKKEGPVDNQVKPLLPCSSCGLYRVKPRRPSESGEHYCTAPECRRAKARAYYNRNLRIGSDVDAPTTCFNCKAELDPRKVRSNDSPHGRWCQRRACREHKRRYHEEFPVGTDTRAVESMRLRAELTDAFAAQVLEGNFLRCQECGNEKTLPDFKHPTLVDGHFQWCRGGGPNGVPAPLAPKVWPKEMHVYFNPPTD